MIKRELYMNRIRPFIGGELIKVMTGIRRSGKSVMLELIKEELAEAGWYTRDEIVEYPPYISVGHEMMKAFKEGKL